MNQSMYDEDKRKEELLGMWLDEHFYPNFTKHYKSIKRNKDVELQKRGVDVIVENLNGGLIYVDEKATLQYINKNIPTFAFEIKNTTSGKQGWLYNPRYITDYYLLVWPNATDDSIPDKNAFTSAEAMSIERNCVIKMLTDRNITEQRIMKYVEEFSKGPNIKSPIAEGITLNFNKSLHEKPINIVVRKEILSKYAKKIYEITTQKIIIKKQKKTVDLLP